MSTFPFDYSSFLYIALQRYNVLLLVQVEQDEDTKANRRQFKWTLLVIIYGHIKKEIKSLSLLLSYTHKYINHSSRIRSLINTALKSAKIIQMDTHIQACISHSK